MRKEWLIAAAVLLAGCATTDGLREKGPALVLDSAQSPEAFGQCVASKWGEMYGLTVNQLKKPDGTYSVNIPNQVSGTNGLLDAIPTAGGTQAKIYLRSGSGGHKKLLDAAQTCK